MKKQYYLDYKKWEDYNHGFYNTQIDREEDYIKLSVRLLSNKEKFDEKCRMVLCRWINSSKVHLTNPDMNHKAWLGQAACCYNHNAPSYITRIAWWQLTEHEQKVANRIAKKHIDDFLTKLYENEYTQKTIDFERI